MNRAFILLATLLLIFPLAAQQPQAPPPETGSIEGVVLKAATGEPIKKPASSCEGPTVDIKEGAIETLQLKLISAEKPASSKHNPLTSEGRAVLAGVGAVGPTLF